MEGLGCQRQGIWGGIQGGHKLRQPCTSALTLVLSAPQPGHQLHPSPPPGAWQECWAWGALPVAPGPTHTWTKGGHPSSGYDGGSVRPTEKSWPLPPGPPFSPSPAEASLTCGALLTPERLLAVPHPGRSKPICQPTKAVTPSSPCPHPPGPRTGLRQPHHQPAHPAVPMETSRKAPAHVSWPVARHWRCPVGPCWPCLLFLGLHEDKNFCLRDSHSHICVFTVSD